MTTPSSAPNTPAAADADLVGWCHECGRDIPRADAHAPGCPQSDLGPDHPMIAPTVEEGETRETAKVRKIRERIAKHETAVRVETDYIAERRAINCYRYSPKSPRGRQIAAEIRAAESRLRTARQRLADARHALDLQTPAAEAHLPREVEATEFLDVNDTRVRLVVEIDDAGHKRVRLDVRGGDLEGELPGLYYPIPTRGEWGVETTPEQRAAILAQVQVYDAPETPCAGLVGYSVVRYGEVDDAVSVTFRYRHDDGSDTLADGERVGVEQTVFAADGDVITSQDFG